MTGIFVDFILVFGLCYGLAFVSSWLNKHPRLEPYLCFMVVELGLGFVGFLCSHVFPALAMFLLLGALFFGAFFLMVMVSYARDTKHITRG